jgi:hypothetical protein
LRVKTVVLADWGKFTILGMGQAFYRQMPLNQPYFAIKSRLLCHFILQKNYFGGLQGTESMA